MCRRLPRTSTHSSTVAEFPVCITLPQLLNESIQSSYLLTRVYVIILVPTHFDITFHHSHCPPYDSPYTISSIVTAGSSQLTQGRGLLVVQQVQVTIPSSWNHLSSEQE
jgi:hypothetical protein